MGEFWQLDKILPFIAQLVLQIRRGLCTAMYHNRHIRINNNSNVVWDPTY